VFVISSDVNKDLGLKAKIKDLDPKTKAQGLESQGQGLGFQGQGQGLEIKIKFFTGLLASFLLFTNKVLWVFRCSHTIFLC